MADDGPGSGWAVPWCAGELGGSTVTCKYWLRVRFLWNKMGNGRQSRPNFAPQCLPWAERCAGGCCHAEIMCSLAGMGEAAVDQLSSDALTMCSAQRNCSSGFAVLKCYGPALSRRIPCPQQSHPDILAGVLTETIWFWGFNPLKCS